MIGVNDWEGRRVRYEQYWNKANKTPLLYITAPADSFAGGGEPEPVSAGRMDFAGQCRVSRYWMERTYFGGDSYPYYLPDLGYDPATAMMGLETVANDVSSWAVHQDKPLSAFTEFSFDETNEAYQTLLGAVRFYVEDARSGDDIDYIVGMIPFNTLYDGVASLIGPERLCLEMVDHPEEVHRVAQEHFRLFCRVYSVFEELTLRYQKGSTNWLGVYSDVPWYYISDDFIVMLSSELFDEFIVETLEPTVRFHPRTLFHLDGENAVRHLDALLQIRDLTGVQVQATPFRQSAEFWTPYLQKIQSAGKTAWIEARHSDDLRYLVQHLEPEGLFIKTYADTQTEAREMERFVRDYYGR